MIGRRQWHFGQIHGSSIHFSLCTHKFTLVCVHLCKQEPFESKWASFYGFIAGKLGPAGKHSSGHSEAQLL